VRPHGTDISIEKRIEILEEMHRFIRKYVLDISILEREGKRVERENKRIREKEGERKIEEV